MDYDLDEFGTGIATVIIDTIVIMVHIYKMPASKIAILRKPVCLI